MGLIKDTLYKVSGKGFLTTFKTQSIFPYYHLVRDNQVPHIEHLYEFKNRPQFENDIRVLTSYYTPMNPRDLLQNKDLKNNFLLTFDDGLQEIYTVIYPILKSHNLKAIFFVNPKFVDNNEGLYKHYISIIISHLEKSNFEKSVTDKISQILSFDYSTISEFKQKFLNIRFSERHKIKEVLTLLSIDIQKLLKEYQPYVTKEQIQEMIDDGFYFGGHTMTHPPLYQLTHEEQKREIIDSMDWLKENFDIDYSFFAFPFSDKSISRKLLAELFEYDNNIRIFGNAGLKKDIDERIIQRFSLENPEKQTEKQIVTENLYKIFNQLVGKYHIKRQ